MVARSGVPGAAVAVVAGDTAMYERCFGLREMGRPDEVDDDTLFQLGAVSRAYTTTMLAALAGEGELRWDQPVRRVWPAFRLSDRWATREATFRDLTAGRSGLPAYAGDELRAFGYGRDGGAAAAALPAPGRRLPRRVRAAGRPGDGGGRRRGARRRRLRGRACVRERVLEPIGDDGTVLTWRGFVRAVDRATPHTSGGRVDGPAGSRGRDGVRAVPRRQRQPQRAGDLRPPAAQRRRGRRRAGGAGRAARADAAAGDGGGARAVRARGGRPRLDALELRRPAARERRRRPRERLERRRDAGARRRRRRHRAGQRVPRGGGAGQGARQDARRPRRARRAAGRLARARAGRRPAGGEQAGPSRRPGLALPPRAAGRRAGAARAATRTPACTRTGTTAA